MSWVNEYRETTRYLSKAEVIAEKRELCGIINGDALFPLSSWPRDLRLAFWKKPIGDRETFKLMLFCLGNGCSPPLICRWILLSQTWAPKKAEKRARQLDFVLNNAEAKRGTWFYFDLDHNKLLYLNGVTETVIPAPTRSSRKTLKIQEKS